MTDTASELLCPNCGCNCIHHDRITVYDRGEDALQTIVTEVTGGQVTTAVLESAQSNNPSSRRHGLAIRFWCEGCSAQPELTLSQHKGMTFLGWRNTSPRRLSVVDSRQR